MDLILFNGIIKTMNRSQPDAEAVAIRGGLVAAVGDNQSILAMKTDQTRMVDLKRQLVLPGFIDAHLHLTTFGVSLQECDLHGSKSAEELIARTRQFISEKKVPDEQWVIGKRWHQDYFDVKVLPTRQQLDRISTRHPVCLMTAGMHALVVNTKAIERAGLDASSKQVEGGHFETEPDGYPNGIFKESAMNLIYRKLPPKSLEDIKTYIRDACAYASRCGITSVQTDDLRLPGAKFGDIIEAYKELHKYGEIHVRIYEQCNLPDREILREFLEQGYRTGVGDSRFKIGPYKVLSDGAIGVRTAALAAPYADDPNNCGIPIYTQEELDELLCYTHESGMQIAVHCIGDKASHMTLDAFEKALAKKPRPDHRHTIIHCQILDDQLVERFRDMGIIASVQPGFLNYDLHVAEGLVGQERIRTSYNWRTLLDQGIAVAFGSDSPVEPMDVLPGIHCAVNRQDFEGIPAGGWHPEEAVSVEEAVYAFTKGAAYGSFEENLKGSLEPGLYADLVVLDQNLFAIAPTEIRNVKPVMTVMNGEIVWQADTWF